MCRCFDVDRWSIVFFALSTVVFFAGCSPSGNTELSQFAETYIAAHQAKDVETLLGLVALPPGCERLRSFVTLALSEEVTWPLRDFQTEVIPQAERSRLRGKYSLDPIWRIYVILDTDDRFTSVWLAGENEEGVRLVVEIDDRTQENDDYPAPKRLPPSDSP